MSKPAKSAQLILELYELRREPTMREARNWFISYFPESADEIIQTMIDPATSAKFRMVISYWDMAASFVNHGAIDEAMFHDASGEPMVFFAKISPYLDELREKLQWPGYLKHLETLVKRTTDAETVLKVHRERTRRWMTARDEMIAKSAG